MLLHTFVFHCLFYGVGGACTIYEGVTVFLWIDALEGWRVGRTGRGGGRRSLGGGFWCRVGRRRVRVWFRVVGHIVGLCVHIVNGREQCVGGVFVWHLCVR